MASNSCYRCFKKSVSLLFRSKNSCSLVSHMPKACLSTNNLIGAVCVERPPILTARKSRLEQTFQNLLNEKELESSYLSDHEIRLLKERENLKKNEPVDSANDKETETALDLEDKWEAELKAFTPAARETEADRTNNRKSLERKLDTTLYLLVKQKIEGKDHWVLPQAYWKEGETMRQTAERALNSVCGEVKATFLGNAPCAFDYHNPAKIFFFKAWYREGSVAVNKDLASDYLWVSQNELKEYCFPSYNKGLKKFIVPL
ncbi:large ribosomal subunit protein mL46-like [Physella acuta]|uniref:large ribosomal subunit protein mL46-like n=1 Tax=Physella acuta TaxID=109671 RepID=UPI0027DC0D41|nr:large ribosomal subunit protein mL46-like [Physella acuta]